jgi:hypothetical protein
MSRVKINVGLRNKTDAQEQYVSADELSVQEVADTERGEGDMRTVRATASDTETTKRKRKKKTKGEDKAKRKANLMQAWSKSISNANEDLDDVLDDDDVQDLGHRMADIQDEALPIGQKWLSKAKRNSISGNVMAANEATMQVRETIANGKDIYHGGQWVLGKVSGLFGGGA